jgi:hypothetical protein
VILDAPLHWLQVGGVIETVDVIGDPEEIFTLNVLKHPFASVILKVYAPLHKPLATVPVCPLLQLSV